MRIRRLSETIHGRIDSEIVLEGLNDVVYEIIKNGIEAKSDNIRVNIRVNYVTSVIEIEYKDNGTGIDPESMELFGQRHCSSKDEKCRGVAVNSIMNISGSMIIISRVKEYNSGFKMIFNGIQRIGDVVKNGDDSLGTNLRILGLYDRVPIRKKIVFEKLDKRWASEGSLIKQRVVECLIDNPCIDVVVNKYEFRGNKWKMSGVCSNSIKTKEKLPFHHQMMMIRNVLDNELFKNYEIYKIKGKGIELKVGIGLETVQNKNYQFLFYNGEKVNNEYLLKFISNEFQNNYDKWGDEFKRGEKRISIYGHAYSVNAIYLASFKGSEENINIESAKGLLSKAIRVYFGVMKGKKRKEEKLVNGKILDDKERKREEKVLKSRMLVSQIDLMEIEGRMGTIKNEGSLENRVIDMDQLRMKCHDCNDHQSQSHSHADVPLSQEETTSQYFGGVKIILNREDIMYMEVIGQCDKKFIIVKQRKSGDLYAMDQHACDERIRVEEMYKSLEEGKSPIVEIVPPYEIQFKQDDLLKVERSIEKGNLSKWGVEISIVDNNNNDDNDNNNSRGLITVNKLPWVTHRHLDGKNDATRILQRGISEAVQEINIGKMPSFIRECAKSWACRGAIMFGDVITIEEQHRIVNKLAECRLPYECAHGRPSLYPLGRI